MLDLMALSEAEAAELVGCRLSSEGKQAFIEASLEFLRAECPELQLIVTAGKSGAYAFAGGSYNYCPAPSVEVASSAGAGDALLGGVLAAIACGIPLLRPRPQDATDRLLDTALDLGVLLASYKCLSPHSINPSASVETLADFAHGPGLGSWFGIDPL
jgi:sugar/nucleoside kinase (ribokinase family)